MMRSLVCSHLCRSLSSLSLLSTRYAYIRTSRFCTTPTQPTEFIDIKHWVPPATSQVAERDLTKQPIPSTRKWTIEELKFFNLHYYQLSDPALWSTYFCDKVPMRPEAEDIALSKFDVDDIIQGAHSVLPVHLRLFGEKLYNTLVAQRTETATDDLVLYLLQVCNPGTILLAEPRIGQFKIKVGKHKFVSIPDASVEARTKVQLVGPTFVVAEDKTDPELGKLNQDAQRNESQIRGSNERVYEKKWQMSSVMAKKEDPSNTPTKSYQLAGEMLAAAVRNFNVYRQPQTVFGLRVVGTRMTLHRADFPVSYLKSIKKGTPTGNITILRMGGSHSFEDRGISLLHNGEDRKNLIHWICNIMNACEQIAISLKDNKVPSITSKRVAQLQKYL